jgi:hypothetical protein
MQFYGLPTPSSGARRPFLFCLKEVPAPGVAPEAGDATRKDEFLMATQSVAQIVLIDKPAPRRPRGRPAPAPSLLDQILDKLATLDVEDLQRVEAAVERLSAGQALVGLDGFAPAAAA